MQSVCHHRNAMLPGQLAFFPPLLTIFLDKYEENDGEFEYDLSDSDSVVLAHMV